MGYDIYGNNLRSGHCEVHPYVHEEYPCSVCLQESEQEAIDKAQRKEYEKEMREDYEKSLLSDTSDRQFDIKPESWMVEFIKENEIGREEFLCKEHPYRHVESYVLSQKHQGYSVKIITLYSEQSFNQTQKERDKLNKVLEDSNSAFEKIKTDLYSLGRDSSDPSIKVCNHQGRENFLLLGEK